MAKKVSDFFGEYAKRDHKIILGVPEFGTLCQKIRFLCLPKLLFGVWHAWFDVRWYVVLWFGMVVWWHLKQNPNNGLETLKSDRIVALVGTSSVSKPYRVLDLKI